MASTSRLLEEKIMNFLAYQESLKKKTLRELEAMLKKSQQFVKEYPQFEHSWHNEYLHYLKAAIAERIGRK